MLHLDEEKYVIKNSVQFIKITIYGFKYMVLIEFIY